MRAPVAEVEDERHARGGCSSVQGRCAKLTPPAPGTIDMPEMIQPHILVVDDDPQIRALVQEYLTENALRVSATSSGQQMATVLEEEAIDLVVLDLRLAGEDGMAIARTLRDKSAIPIIIVTGVRDEADRIMGLELGADDYLTKPFSPRELLARIQAVLRRAAPATSPANRADERRIQSACISAGSATADPHA